MEVDGQLPNFSRVTSNAGSTNFFKPPNESNTTTAITAAASERLRQWPHSSRIIRVSRASGGKDRHSKVWTARGPRDRRVRLSVNTAIRFYDLQDRLGFEQPSKAVEWLIKAAEDAINELPALNGCCTFPPETPRRLSDDREAYSADLEPNRQISRSGCSSNNSENSKGSESGLSLSRSEIRVKARERARDRTTKEKERESEQTRVRVSSQPQNPENNVSSISQTSSFTQLLTAGTITTAMDYFASSSRQIQLGNSSHLLPYHQAMAISVMGENHQQQHHHNQQHFPFVSDFNFTVSSSSTNSGSLGRAGFNRGTLQSNSTPSLFPNLPRFSITDGSTVPFFLGGAIAAPADEDHQHHHKQFQPPGLQLCYGDEGRQSDQKGKSKNS